MQILLRQNQMFKKMQKSAQLTNKSWTMYLQTPIMALGLCVNHVIMALESWINYVIKVSDSWHWGHYLTIREDILSVFTVFNEIWIGKNKDGFENSLSLQLKSSWFYMLVEQNFIEY
jgi:hypothetical protein